MLRCYGYFRRVPLDEPNPDRNLRLNLNTFRFRDLRLLGGSPCLTDVLLLRSVLSALSEVPNRVDL